MNQADELYARLDGLRRTLVAMRPPGGGASEMIDGMISQLDADMDRLRGGTAKNLHQVAQRANEVEMLIGGLQSMQRAGGAFC